MARMRLLEKFLAPPFYKKVGRRRLNEEHFSSCR
jgi:hypothetical protein